MNWDDFDDIDGIDELSDDDVFDIADELVDKYIKENFGENNEELNGTYIMHPKAIQVVEECEKALRACIRGEDIEIESETIPTLGSIIITVKGKNMAIENTELFAKIVQVYGVDFLPIVNGKVSIGFDVHDIFYKVVEDV